MKAERPSALRNRNKVIRGTADCVRLGLGRDAMAAAKQRHPLCGDRSGAALFRFGRDRAGGLRALPLGRSDRFASGEWGRGVRSGRDGGRSARWIPNSLLLTRITSGKGCGRRIFPWGLRASFQPEEGTRSPVVRADSTFHWPIRGYPGTMSDPLAAGELPNVVAVSIGQLRTRPGLCNRRRRPARSYIDSGAEMPSRPRAFASVVLVAAISASRPAERSGSASSMTRASR